MVVSKHDRDDGTVLQGRHDLRRGVGRGFGVAHEDGGAGAG